MGNFCACSKEKQKNQQENSYKQSVIAQNNINQNIVHNQNSQIFTNENKNSVLNENKVPNQNGHEPSNINNNKKFVPSPPKQTNIRCKVFGCNLPHNQHSCSVCRNQDANHLEMHCPNQKNNQNNRNHINSNFRCKVPGCLQNHQHYCKNCKNNDSDHFSSNCPNMTGNENNENQIKCRVPNCNENHKNHNCKNCNNNDSDHFSHECPFLRIRQSQLQEQQNNRCKASGCTKNHDFHYCKNCSNNDSDHLARNCPRNQNSKCKVPNCQEKHLKHFCRHCLNSDSSHFTSECTIMKCKVANCIISHSKHFCRICRNNDSDHFSSNCKFNSIKTQNMKCKVKNCTQNHSEHYCRFCDKDDADHFALECPDSTFLFHATKLDYLEMDNGIREIGLRPSTSQKVRFGPAIYLADETNAKHIKSKYGEQDGVVLKCRVWLGKMKNFGRHNTDFAGNWIREGYDSCTAIHPAWHTPKEFQEYAVKNPRKVKIYNVLYKGQEFKMVNYEKDKKLLDKLKNKKGI